MKSSRLSPVQLRSIARVGSITRYYTARLWALAFKRLFKKSSRYLQVQFEVRTTIVHISLSLLLAPFTYRVSTQVGTLVVILVSAETKNSSFQAPCLTILGWMGYRHWVLIPSRKDTLWDIHYSLDGYNDLNEKIS